MGIFSIHCYYLDLNQYFTIIIAFIILILFIFVLHKILILILVIVIKYFGLMVVNDYLYILITITIIVNNFIISCNQIFIHLKIIQISFKSFLN